MIERTIYERTQRGYAVLAIVAGVIAVLVVVAVARDVATIRVLGIAVVALVASAIAFSSLTVQVTERSMRWWFAFRPIGMRVDLEAIESLEPVRTTLLQGYGIHLTRNGWLWNVSGFNAVGIRLKDGRRFAIGSQEPNTVIAAIDRAKTAGAGIK